MGVGSPHRLAEIADELRAATPGVVDGEGSDALPTPSLEDLRTAVGGFEERITANIERMDEEAVYATERALFRTLDEFVGACRAGEATAAQEGRLEAAQQFAERAGAAEQYVVRDKGHRRPETEPAVDEQQEPHKAACRAADGE